MRGIIRKLDGYPLLQEFAEYLHRREAYSEEEIERLLTKEWDAAYPAEFLGEDLLIQIGNFLYYMADFACTKIFGEDYWRDSSLDIRIVPEPSYEDRSYVYILEFNTRTVLACGCGHKTWHHDPDELEEDLKELLEGLRKGKRLLAVRRLTDS